MAVIESPATGEVDQPADALFREAKQRRRRRHLVAAGAVVVALGLGVAAWWLSNSSTGGPPPATPTGTALSNFPSPIPPGARPLSTRVIHGWTFRVYGTPSGLPIAKVKAAYELLDPAGRLRARGSSTVGASLLARPGVVDEGGGSGPGLWTIGNYQVSLPNIVSIRAVSNGKVLDSMVPSSLDGVRFVVLAVEVRSAQKVTVQGLSANGKVISWTPFVLTPTGPYPVSGSVGILKKP
jgi:hypothetical protein